MGSHSARHRPARRRADRPEERATALLARLGAAAPAGGSAPTRHAARVATGPLDPYATAPFPARTPRPAEGGTRCSGGRTILHERTGTPVNPVGVPLTLPAPRRAPDDLIGEEPVELAPAFDVTGGDHPGSGDLPAAGHLGDEAVAWMPRHRRPIDDTAPWSFPEALATAAPAPPQPPTPGEAPAGLSPDDIPAAPGKGLRRHAQPIIAALSVTAVGVTAVLTATGGAEPGPAPAEAATALGATPAGALSFALPTADPATPQAATPQPVTGPASVLAADPKPVQVSDIVAKAVADARSVADKQASDQKAAADQAAADKAAADKAAAKARAAVATTVPTHAPGGGSASGTGNAAAGSTGSSIGARALAAARTKIGKPYVWGAAGPNSFDCSGLVMWAFNQVGVSLPHSSASQSTMGTAVSKANLQPGDLVFFYTPVSHVGIYIGNGQVLHASEPGEPVKITDMAYMPFHNARRISG